MTRRFGGGAAPAAFFAASFIALKVAFLFRTLAAFATEAAAGEEEEEAFELRWWLFLSAAAAAAVAARWLLALPGCRARAPELLAAGLVWLGPSSFLASELLVGFM